MGLSLGGSKNKSKGSSIQNIWDPQGQALEGMYGSAADTYDATRGSGLEGQRLAPGAEGRMGDVYNLGMGGMEGQMGGGSYGDTADARAMLMSNMQQPSQTGRMYEDIVGGPGNTYIDPMVDAMKQGSMQNLGMMQSGNAMDANAMGQGGSSRHAMQNAMTNKQVNQDMLNREMGMRGNAYDTDMGWKMGIANQADMGNQMNSNRLMEMMGGADANTQAAMGYAPTAQGNAMGEYAPWMMANQMPWQNMDMYANVLGEPTTLTEQQTKGKGGSFSFGS
jgi:hypothetical protein